MEQPKKVPHILLNPDYKPLVLKLSAEEKGNVFEALFRHFYEEELPPLTDRADMLFSIMAADMDKHKQNYLQTCSNRKRGRAQNKAASAEDVLSGDNGAPGDLSAHKSGQVVSEDISDISDLSDKRDLSVHKSGQATSEDISDLSDKRDLSAHKPAQVAYEDISDKSGQKEEEGEVEEEVEEEEEENTPPYPLSRSESGGVCLSERELSDAAAAEQKQSAAEAGPLKTETAAGLESEASAGVSASAGADGEADAAPRPAPAPAKKPRPKRRSKAVQRVEDILSEEELALFSQLWAVWPKKTGKKDAALVWKKLQPDEQTLAAMLASVERHKRVLWKDTSVQFVPGLSVWLNGRRWDDELPQQAGAAAVQTEELTGDDLERFERVWAAWPKKTARRDAMMEWRKLGVDDALLETILAAIEAHKGSTWKNMDAQYLPRLCHWLEGRRWEDEIPEVLTPAQAEKKRLQEKLQQFRAFRDDPYEDDDEPDYVQMVLDEIEQERTEAARAAAGEQADADPGADSGSSSPESGGEENPAAPYENVPDWAREVLAESLDAAGQASGAPDADDVPPEIRSDLQRMPAADEGAWPDDGAPAPEDRDAPPEQPVASGGLHAMPEDMDFAWEPEEQPVPQDKDAPPQPDPEQEADCDLSFGGWDGSGYPPDPDTDPPQPDPEPWGVWDMADENLPF